MSLLTRMEMTNAYSPSYITFVLRILFKTIFGQSDENWENRPYPQAAHPYALERNSPVRVSMRRVSPSLIEKLTPSTA